MSWEVLNTSRYYEFINNIINTRGQWCIPDGEYWEGHHIIPECMGGDGKRRSKNNNIIWLYPEEHYDAHKILFEDNPINIDLALAWWYLSNKNKVSSNEEYANLKKQFSLLMSRRMSGEGNPRYGKHWKVSDETRKKISAATSGSNNPMYGKGYKLRGRKFSDEHCSKIGVSVTSERNGMFGMTGDKNPFYGKHHTDESILKFSTPLYDRVTKKYWKSITDAINDLHVSKHTLLKHLSGKFVKKLKDYDIIKITKEEYLQWKNTQN